jgi:hypothetical protein
MDAKLVICVQHYYLQLLASYLEYNGLSSFRSHPGIFYVVTRILAMLYRAAAIQL